jgi:hypothetical protein
MNLMKTIYPIPVPGFRLRNPTFLVIIYSGTWKEKILLYYN